MFFTRDNVLLRYSFVILLAVAVTTMATRGILVSEIEKHLVRMHAGLYAELIASVKGKNDSPTAFNTLLKRLPHIQDTAVWNTAGLLVIAPESDTFSDTGPLTQSRGKDVMIDALDGKLGFFPVQKKGLVILIPILSDDGQINGVVGLLEDDAELNKDIQIIQKTVSITVLSIGGLLYVLLFGIFLRAYLGQKKAVDRLTKTFDVIVFAMSSLSSLRDQETGGHLERTQAYTKVLLESLRHSPKHHKDINSDYLRDVLTSTPLHDIGKVGIIDSILLKKGKLEPDEFESMKLHSTLGADILADASNKLPFTSSLTIAEAIARHHHEKWDGSGYPDRLSGESIPLAARIVALADVYDALRSSRPYKPAYSHAVAVDIIKKNRGTHFDPDIVDAFLKNEYKFAKIFSTTNFNV